MPLDKEAIKAHLVEHYAAQLEAMLEPLEDDEQLHLTEIEEMALKLRQAVGQTVTEALAVNESQRQAAPDVACSACRQNMRYKGCKAKWLKTRTGDVRVERSYYYCGHCRTGYFPPR